MSFVNTVDQLGDDVVFASIVDGSIVEFKDDTITMVAEHGFSYCTALTTVDLPNVKTIERNCFSASGITSLILRSNTLCTITGDGFNGSPIKNGTGYIYVPSALIDRYKSATNWSNLASQFRALEDYTVGGTITGELDTTKI